VPLLRLMPQRLPIVSSWIKAPTLKICSWPNSSERASNELAGRTHMKLAQIEELIRTSPFRKFFLETAGGNYIEVESSGHLKLPPPGHDLILVYGTDGLVHYLTIDSILNAAVFGPVPHNIKEDLTPE
jgi:hypothetical protein